MRPRSTILGHTDVAIVPFAYAATVGVAAMIRTFAIADGGEPDVPTLVCALVGIVAGTLGGVWISRPAAEAWRERPEPTLAVAVIGSLLVGIASARDGGLACVYLSTLVVGATFFSLVMPRGWSLVALVALVGGAVIAWAFSGDGTASDAVILGTFYASAWWVGSIGHRAHERAVRTATLRSRSDSLTSALNRRGVIEVLNSELAARDGRQTALIILDLDGFKPVNDELGHAAGDDLLSWVGRTIGNGLGPTDELGRLGGDEFAVVLPRGSAKEAALLARRIESALVSRIGVSAGIAVAPVDGLASEELLRAADGRLYEAKGRVDRRRA